MQKDIAHYLRPGTLQLAALPPLSLYVHLPWCLRKCPYCDFNSHEVRAGELPEQRYLDALCADLESALPLIWGRPVHSIFIGGGTPSLFSPQGIDRLLGDIRARLKLAGDCEITLEANPGTFERDRFKAFRAAGVTRLSVGVQSFSDDHLRALGRVHDSAQAIAALEEAALAFDTFNLDLMYALPGQSLAQLEQDVTQALALMPPHLSIYHLTIEPNTYFAKFPPQVPTDDLAFAMLDRITEMTQPAGLQRYEVSAYAKPGHRCWHNLNYWQFGDYLGIGAGAHGKLSFPHRVVRQVRWRDPKLYMDNALAGNPLAQDDEVARADLPFEFMLNALRLQDGFETQLFTERTGLPLSALEPALGEAQARGLLERDLARIRPTARGYDFLSDLQSLFLPSSSQPMNALDAIARQARAYPDRPALTSRGRTYSFRQLWGSAGAMAYHLKEQGVQAGSGVALLRMPNESHLLAVLALARLGAVSTTLPTRMPAAELRNLLSRHGVTHVLYGGDEVPGLEGVKLVAESSVLRPLPQAARSPALAQGLGNALWRISLSSGTTGERKSIPWTHGQRSALERQSLEVYPGGPGERLLLFADTSLGFAMGHALNHIASGGLLVLPRLSTPEHCAHLIETTHPTRLVATTGVAFNLAEHFKGRPGGAAQLGLLSVLLAGSAVPPALMLTLEEHLCQNIWVSYGSTEFGTVARSDVASRLEKPEAAGRLMPWIEGQAVDAAGQPLAAGETGLLRFRARGGEMATQYLGDAEATAKAFRGGWFYPGDTGSIDAQGYLVLGGREDSRLNIDGLKIDPLQVERELEAEPGVLEVAAVPVQLEQGRKALVAAIVADGTPDMRALRKKLRELAGGLAVVVKIDSLPKNEGGKVMREQLSRSLKQSIGAQLKIRKAGERE